MVHYFIKVERTITYYDTDTVETFDEYSLYDHTMYSTWNNAVRVLGDIYQQITRVYGNKIAKSGTDGCLVFKPGDGELKYSYYLDKDIDGVERSKTVAARATIVEITHSEFDNLNLRSIDLLN